MIDIKALQKDFKTVSLALQKKGVEQKLLDELKAKSQKAKLVRQNMESIQAKQNELSSQFGQYKKENKDISVLQEEIAKLKQEKQKKEFFVSSISPLCYLLFLLQFVRYL
jgi:seryl-tRNA synthetase